MTTTSSSSSSSDENINSSSSFNGLTKNSIITIFNEEKEESERITIEEFILVFNSGLIDYSILGYDLINNKEEFYSVSEVFLMEKNKQVTVLSNSTIDMSLSLYGNKLVTHITDKDSLSTTKKINKISVTDNVLIHNKNLCYSLETNWMKNSDVVYEDTYMITILNGLAIMVNDIVITL